MARRRGSPARPSELLESLVPAELAVSKPLYSHYRGCSRPYQPTDTAVDLALAYIRHRQRGELDG